jgi:arylsulfatase A
MKGKRAMKKIKSLTVVAGMILLVCTTRATEYPNIVFIMADDMGIGDISALNDQSKIQTPNLDRLIGQGMNFTDAHTASAVCTPTRYGVLTGRYPWRSELKNGVLNGYSKALIAPELDTVPKLLKRAGYSTAMTGKWHLGFNWSFKEGIDAVHELKPDSTILENQVDYTKPFSGGPVDCGFDYFYGMVASPGMSPYTFLENNRVAALPTERQAWFGPRDNFPAGKKKDYERKAQMLRPGLKAPGFSSSQVMLRYTEKAVDYIKQQAVSKPFFLYVPYASPHTPVFPRAPFAGTSQAGIYGDFVQELDWSVGQIFQALEDQGVSKNTIVIFTADNGHAPGSFPMEFKEKFGHDPERGLNGHKANLLEGGHRVPFIVRWPARVKAASQCDATICLNDLYATCAALTGQKKRINQGVDSYDMLDLLLGGKAYSRPNSVYGDYGGKFAIRKGDWKLILDPAPNKRQLFNLKDDLNETQNKAKNPEFKSMVDELMDEITRVVRNGRTTAGPQLENDGSPHWKQLYWMEK